MNDKPSVITRLFRFIWRAAVAIYRLVVVLALLVSLLMVWALFHGGPPVTIENHVALVIAPTGTLMEQIDRDAGEAFFDQLSDRPPQQSLLRDVTDALQSAADDARISFAVLKLDGLKDASLAQLEEIVAAMKQFRASGKKIYAYGPWYEQSHYFLAAQADEAALDPEGLVSLEGFSSYNNYFKDALDKLGVQVNVFRVGEYKSAVEPFIRNDMSEEARAANREWLSDLWGEYTARISAARKLPPTAPDDYVKNLRSLLEGSAGDSAQVAKDSGLINKVETLVEFRKRMGAMVGFDDKHGSFRQINYVDYLRGIDHEDAKTKGPDKKVALVVVQGDIVDGEGDENSAGGDMVARLLDEARRDASVAAVVLRVDSPGGSVWASEQIRRAVKLLRTEGKPVIASMSGVAASGGYWVSMDADEIFASPSTITGSIGIFGLIPTIDKPLAKLGIHTDGVGTTPLAGAFRVDRPISPEVAGIIQSQINKGYHDFISGVAAARKLPVEKVDEIARGRVWSGARAMQLGLVDKSGGLEEASNEAAKLAHLPAGAWELQEFSPKRGFASRLVSRFSGHISERLLPDWLAQLAQQAQALQPLAHFNDPSGMYARCFCAASMGGRLH